MRSPIDYTEFIHPQDEAALKTLDAIPMLDTVLKQYMKMFDENMFRGINMVTKIRIGPDQLPHIYHHLPEICDVLGIIEPEFYLEMNPIQNSYTFGDTNPFIVVNSGLVQLLTEDELRTVIAHECGHILCHHVLYHSLARLFYQFGSSFFRLVNNVTAPLYWSLMYWSRRSEYSADRVAAFVMNDWKPLVHAMMRLSGGGPNITHSVNMDRYLSQMDDYKNLMDESVFNKYLQTWAIKDEGHPFPGIRSVEVKRWFEERQTDVNGGLQEQSDLSW